MAGFGWRRLARRVLSAMEMGLCSMNPFPVAPWPDLPTQGWVVGADGKPVPVAVPMDGGPQWGAEWAPARPPCSPLTAAEQRAWAQLEEQLARG